MKHTILTKYLIFTNTKIYQSTKKTPPFYRELKSDVRLSVHPTIFQKLSDQTDPAKAFDYFDLMNERSLLTVRVNESKIPRNEVF